ncbi:MAG: IPT/TIG domain-containing protein [Nitrosomonadales bacterium]|nr:IPT/TIG domain-containing protein [Nitrosomonadales bacterium]
MQLLSVLRHISRYGISLTVFSSLLIIGCGGGGGNSPAVVHEVASFSDYYPMSKGTYRTYRITAPGRDTQTLTQTWTNGATYNGNSGVRTCESAIEWEDIARVGDKTLSYAFVDSTTSVVIRPSTPVVLGVDNWQPGQTVSTNTTIQGIQIKTDVTYIDKQAVVVPAATFLDTMRVNFSINDGAVSGTSWYARGVGLVRETHSDGETWELVESGQRSSPAPVLTSFLPAAGAVDGGSLLTLTGGLFQQGAQVIVGNKRAPSPLLNGAGSITAYVPLGALGVTDVTIVNPDCQVALLENQFEYKNVWTSTSTAGAPDARTSAGGIWTGTEMIAWGGHDGNSIAKNTGARFDPVSNAWRPMSTVGAPSPRWGHTSVWTGQEMIVWGGFSGAFQFQTLADGARYNPQTDTWAPVSSTGAPTARYNHTATWTGSEMIVWGGYACTACTNSGMSTGARYNPITDSWVPVQSTNAPSGRGNHTSIWTGSRMIIWGGDTGNPGLLNDGGIYDPGTDTWSATNLSGAPTPRAVHGAAWTGSEMIVFGGQTSTISSSASNTGGRYNPSTDTWAQMNSVGAPSSFFTASAPLLWSGTEIIAWGGSGARYNPVADVWSAMWTTGQPAGSSGHVAVWTGSKLVVWGGQFAVVLNSGGIYDPNVDPSTGSAPLPAISTITPANGPIAGGTALTITGTNFRPEATVLIGGKPATNVIVIGTDTIQAISPSGNPGYADVVITIPEIPWWKVTAVAGFTYTPFSFEGWIGGGTSGWQTGLAPSGRPGDAEFIRPSGIVVDSAGNIYVADEGNNRVQKWNIAGTYLGWIGGGVPGWQTGAAPVPGSGNGQMSGPTKIAIDDSGNIYVSDSQNHRIQKWSASGSILGWIGGGLGGWQSGSAPAAGSTNCHFNQPMGVVLDSSGNIYVADKENHRVQKWSTNGVCLGWIGSGVAGWQTGSAPASGNANGVFKFPMDVATDSIGNIYVADTWNWRIQKWDSAGNIQGWIGGGANGWQTGTAPSTGGTATGEFKEVFGVSVDANGNIYAANSGAHAINKWTAQGNIVGWIGNAQYGWQTGAITGTYGDALGFFKFPWDMTIGPDGKLYVADSYNARIQRWKE